jgi:hypothetical protein
MMMQFGCIRDLLKDDGVVILSKVNCISQYDKKLFDISPDVIHKPNNISDFFKYKDGIYTKNKTRGANKKLTPLDMETKLCVVFDIDETLIQFINPANIAVWEKTTVANKKKMNFVESNKNDKQKIIIFRPFIRELFAYFMKNRDTISVGLWTYSERDYAEDIGAAICKFCDLPKDFFEFRYGSEDMDDDENPKDLRTVYRNFPRFNVFNTFLVDDLYSNVTHDVNKENAILIAPYGPYSHEKTRHFATTAELTKSNKDDVLHEIIKVCKAVVLDIGGCSSEDIKEGFKTENVFSPRRVRRMGLDAYFKTYQRKKNFQMMNIGTSIEYETFGIKPFVKPKAVKKTKTKKKTVSAPEQKPKTLSKSKSSKTKKSPIDELETKLKKLDLS